MERARDGHLGPWRAKAAIDIREGAALPSHTGVFDSLGAALMCGSDFCVAPQFEPGSTLFRYDGIMKPNGKTGGKVRKKIDAAADPSVCDTIGIWCRHRFFASE